MTDDLNDQFDEFDNTPAVHTIVAVHQSSDFVEWSCPTCGRRVRVSQAGGLTVLHQGDRDALHRGGVGVAMGAPSIKKPAPRKPETIH